jgi:hypothetical protein
MKRADLPNGHIKHTNIPILQFQEQEEEGKWEGEKYL